MGQFKMKLKLKWLEKMKKDKRELKNRLTLLVFLLLLAKPMI